MRSDSDRRLALYAGETHDCSYLEDRQSTLHYLDPTLSLDPALYAALLHQGFRRSGTWVYRPGCATCSQCVSARIPIDRFRLNRSQRRTLKRNADLDLNWHRSFTTEHFHLYERYLNGRHPDGGMEGASMEECRRFLFADWCDTKLLDMRLQGKLVASAVTDLVPGALSSIYTFFDPGMASRSLGTYGILAQAERARAQGADYLYLGFWIPDSPKMSYKGRFRPLELRLDDRWTVYGSADTLPLPR